MTAYYRDGGSADSKLELQLGGTWTDVTSRTAKASGVEADWTSGTADAAQSADPASLPVSLVNDDGALTPGYPLSPWNGQLGQGTPARLSAAGAARLWAYSTGFIAATCPDSAGLHAAGDIDIRVDCRIAHWSGILAGKNPSWQMQLDGNGLLSFAWGDGTRVWAAFSTVQPQPGRRCLRAVLSVSAGTVTFYTAPGGAIDAGTWTQLGDVVNPGSGATTVTTTGALLLGGGVPGDYWEMRLLIAGSVVANPSPASQSPGVPSFADGHGNTFTLGSHATVTDRDWRMHGAIAANVRTAPPPLAKLAIAGPLRRLQRGSAPPVKSALRRAIEAQTGTLAPHAYWTWEDPAGSAQVSSDIGGPPMFCDPARLPQFAADSSFACSAPLPLLGTTAMRGLVPAYTSHGSLIYRFLLRPGSAIGTPPATGWPLVRIAIASGGTATNLDFRVYSGYGIGIQGGNSAGDVFNSGAVNFGLAAGSQVYVSLELRPSGGTVNWALVTVVPGASSGSTVSGSYAGSIGKATSVLVHAGALSDWVVGHGTLQSDWVSMFSLGQPLAAWDGEPAAKRVARLGSENGYDVRVIGAPGVSAAMGPQAVAPLATLLGECQGADGGLLFEPTDSYSIGYRTLASMLNQAPAVTLDYAAGEIPPAPSASDDDTAPLVNDWTVSNADGASARVILDDGSPKSIGVAGTYADTSTANVPASGLPDVAGRLLARSTATGPRYTSAGADLGLLSAGQAAAAAAVMPGDVVAYASMPPTVSPTAAVRLVIIGAEEHLGPGRSSDWNAAQATAYDVIAADDDIRGRAEADLVTLHAGISAGATSANVDVTGPPLVTDGDEFPFDVNADGEQVTIADISGPPSNFLTGQNATLEGGIGTWTAAGGCSVAGSSAQAHAGAGSLAMTATAAGTMTAGHCAAASILTGGLACSPGDTIEASAWFRAATAGRSCAAGVGFYTSAGAFISNLFGPVAADDSGEWVKALASVTAPATAARCRLVAEVLAAGAAGEVHYADGMALGNVTTGDGMQSLTFADGVAVAHAAGAGLTLWTPPAWSPI